MAKTNTGLILSIMNYSKFGALSQCMVIQALEHFTNLVIEQEDDLIKAEEDAIANGKVSIVNYKAWIGVAKEIKQKLDDNVKNF